MATLRVFYSLSKTEITGIKGISPITHILNAPSNCTIILADFEGSLYSTWKDKQFETIYITNADVSIYYFIGYVAKLFFRKQEVEIQCTGWSGKLDHTNFERNYQYVVGLVKSDPPYSGSNYKLEVKDEATLADFTWTDDQWITPSTRDKGICISDNTGDSTSSWTTASYSNSGFTSIVLSGDFPFGILSNDGYWHEFKKNAETFNGTYITMDITGSIATTSLIKQIDIEYNYGIQENGGNGSGGVRIEIYNFATSQWVNFHNYAHDRYCYGSVINWTGLQKWSFTGTDAVLKQYLQTSGGNYVTLRLRLVCFNGSITAGYKSVLINYLKGSIKYRPADYTPVQGKITDNGASWIEATSIDFVAKGVRSGDRIMIGENTIDIATAVIGSVGCNPDIDTNFNKFIARYLRGNNCSSILNSICALESAYWCEQYSSDLPIISMRKPANFVDSGVTLTSADYGTDFEIERPSNNYRYVEVFGNQYWSVYAIADSGSTTSNMVFTITDETISTDADAQSIADGQLALLQNVRESIKISVRGNVADTIQVGTLVTLIMERPTISSAQYPVRRITRSLQNYPNGEIITTLWLGLGETPDEEALGKSIKKALTTARKAITDKLIPQSAGGLPVISYTSLTNKPTIPVVNDSITNGNTTSAPSENAVYDALVGKVSTSGDETIAGVKTFSSTSNHSDVVVSDPTNYKHGSALLWGTSGTPTGFDVVSATAGTIQIIASHDNHNYPLALYDNAADSRCYVQKTVSYTNKFYISAWIASSNVTLAFMIRASNGTDTVGFAIYNSFVSYILDAPVVTTVSAINDTMYHLCIEVDPATGNHVLYYNNIEIKRFSKAIATVTFVDITTSTPNAGYTGYCDALIITTSKAEAFRNLGDGQINAAGFYDTTIQQGLVQYIDGYWFPITAFSNSWVNFGSGYQTARYCKRGKQIYIEGIIAGGTDGQTAFNLPLGFRPPKALILAGIANGAFGFIEIFTNGNVVPHGNNTYHVLQANFGVD